MLFFPFDNHFKILSTKILQSLLKNNNFCPIVCRSPDKISNNSGSIFIPNKIHQNKQFQEENNLSKAFHNN